MKDATMKPSKQRRFLLNAPQHLRGHIVSAHLSESLRNTYKVRSMTLRSGDTVRIVRGDYKGYEGKVLRVDRKKYRVFIEGITREKADGSSILIPIHPSKIEIVRLNLDDKWRNKILKRKKALEKAESPELAKEAKPAEESSAVMAKVEGGE